MGIDLRRARRELEAVLRSGPFEDELGGDAFLVDGSPTHIRLLSRLGGMIAMTLGGFALVMVPVAPGTAAERVSAVAIAVVAIVIGVLLWRSAPSIRMSALDAMVVVAAVLVAVAADGGGPLIGLVPGIYVVLGTMLFALRRWGVALLHTAATAVSYAIVLARDDAVEGPVARWACVMVSVLLTGSLTRWLIGRIRNVALAETAARQEAERTREELERVNGQKQEFLARMSHELRTPLHAILGFGQVLRDELFGRLSAVQHVSLDELLDSGRHLLSLVDDVLDLTQAETGGAELELQDVDVAHTVEDAVATVRSRAERRDVRLTTTVAPAIGTVVADPKRLLQVVLNALTASVRATPHGGVVAVHVTGDASHVELAVRGDGQGPGGLQIAVAGRFVAMHGGRLVTGADTGDGSALRLEVPRRPPAGAGATAPADTAPGTLGEVSDARAALSRAVALLLGFGSIAGFVILAVTPNDLVNRALILGLIGAAAFVAAVYGVLGARISPTAVDFTIATLVGVASIGVAEAGPFTSTAALAYGWVAVLAFALRDRRTAFMVTCLIATSFGAVLLTQPDVPGRFAVWLGLLAVIVLPNLVVSWLVEALERLTVAEHAALETARDLSTGLDAATRHREGFVANVSLELRAPIDRVIELAEQVRGDDGPLSGRQRDYITDIVDAARHLRDLLDDIVALYRLETGDMPVARDDVAVDVALEAACEAVARRARRRGVEIHVEVGEGAARARVDPQHFAQIAGNLLSNAVKFSPDRGRVVVRAASTGGELRLSVADGGMGVLPDQQPLIFEAFHQGTRPVPDHTLEGTGLGLTLVKGLVELHGGRVWVDSQPEHGATFTVALPASSTRS